MADSGRRPRALRRKTRMKRNCHPRRGLLLVHRSRLRATQGSREGRLRLLRRRRPNPDYHQVCTGRTGHAEVVQVTFDPGVVRYRDVLDVFFATTTRRRRTGRAPMSARSIAARFLSFAGAEGGCGAAHLGTERRADLAGAHCDGSGAARAVLPAEEYHQGYYRDNPNQSYCMAVISPKVAKFRKQFADKLRG